LGEFWIGDRKPRDLPPRLARGPAGFEIAVEEIEMRGAKRGVGVVGIDRPGALIGRGGAGHIAKLDLRIGEVVEGFHVVRTQIAGLLQPWQRLLIAAEFVEEDADIVAGGGICRFELVRTLAVGEARSPLTEAAKTYRTK